MRCAPALVGSVMWAACFGPMAACHRASGAVASEPGDAATAWSLEAASGQATPVIAGRCKPAGPVLALGEAAGEDLEIGDAVALDDGAVAVGVLRDGPRGRAATVAWLAHDGAPPELLPLGTAFGDAPPPLLARCRDDVVAATFEVPPAARAPSAEARRSLSIFRAAPGATRAIATISQQRDDSLAFDLACAGPDERALLAVWDETTGAAGATPRGVIRAAAASLGPAPRDAGQAREEPPAHDVSPATSDAELPRAVRRGRAGFFVVWLAHRPEPPAASDASLDFETPAEARAFGWLEMVAVDVAGNPVGPVQRLTPASGHVSTYDVVASGDDAKPAIVAVARDDGESSERADGSGGALLRVRAEDDHVDPPAALPTDGLGRGAPALVEGAGGVWLSWVGPREAPRLLPLDRAGAPAGAPSAEDAFDDARPLVSLSPSRNAAAARDLEPPPGRMLVAIPTDKSVDLRAFACAR